MQMWLIDHHDSFTLNVRDWLLSHPAVERVDVVAYDDPIGLQTVANDRSPIVLSAGPKDPECVQPTMNLIRDLQVQRPVLGICLGHQLLGMLSGGSLRRARTPLHGSSRRLHIQEPVWAERLGSEQVVAVYHSLVLDERTTHHVQVLAIDDDGDVMAIASRDPMRPFMGWQFHPESFLTVNQQLWSSLWIDYCQAFHLVSPLQ